MPKALLDFIFRKTKVGLLPGPATSCLALPRCGESSDFIFESNNQIKVLMWIQKPKSNFGVRYRAKERARNVLKNRCRVNFCFLGKNLRSLFFCLHCHQLSACCAGFLSTTPSSICIETFLFVQFSRKDLLEQKEWAPLASSDIK